MIIYEAHSTHIIMQRYCNDEGLFSTDNREWGSHAHGVHPTEDVEHTSTEVEGRSRHQNNSKTIT